MAVLTFAAGDKDYIAKLNQMSQNAGDTAQLKADTAQIKAETATIKAQTEQVRDQTAQLKTDVETLKAQTETIASGDLLFSEVNTSKAVKHGDLLLAATAGIEFTLDDFKAALLVGHWFTIENTSDGVVFLVSRPDLAIKGKILTVTNGDRVGISPGSSYTFRVINPTTLRML